MAPAMWRVLVNRQAAARPLRAPVGRGTWHALGSARLACSASAGGKPAAGGQRGTRAAGVPDQLAGVRHVVAVASGKGGVGKSSISVNLAYLLARRGKRVGILDADIYGPSLPSLVPVEVRGLHASPDGGIVPVEYEGVRLMSMGYAKPGEHAALRGPLASAMVQQLLTQTKWGELDYLVIDMPPGTGDIHLTVSQTARVSGAVVVSTPQALALADVEKGISMFNQVGIPTIAVAENMSSFHCGSCGTEHDLFDRAGGSKRIADKFGVQTMVQLPMDPALSSKGPGTVPYVCDARNEGRLLRRRLEDLADATVRELDALPTNRLVLSAVPSMAGGSLPPLLELRRSGGEGEDHRVLLAARAVRLACRSARMWDEMTGKQLFREEDIPSDVHAKDIRAAGAYAVHIDWSDGHNTLMAFKTLEALPPFQVS